MQKKSIKIQDLSFIGDKSSSKHHESQFIEWDRSFGEYKKGEPVFFTDLCLGLATLPQYKDSYKIAWLLEPIVINSGTYQFIAQNHDQFDLVLTHHEDLIAANPSKIKYYEDLMSWIDKKDWVKQDKTKNISIIASEKNFAPGHQLRHELIQRAKDKMDLYGRAYNPIQNKVDAQKDYKFSVAIENCRVNSYFTEKLIDCFLTRTVPIYWGPPKIGEFFNKDGILIANDIKDFISIIDRINKNPDRMYYNSLTQKAIEENFEKASSCVVAEDYIFQNILVPNKLV